MTTHGLVVHDALVIQPPAAPPAEPGCIAIADGVITTVEPMSRCRCDQRPEQIVNAAGMAALPGFVDGHRHTWQTVFRQAYSGLSITEYGRAVLGGVAPRLTPDDIYVGTLLGALTAIDSGITFVVDWAHAMNTPAHADAAVAALNTSGIRAHFAYGIPRDGTSRWSVASDLGHPEDLRRVHAELGSHRRLDAVMAARGPEMSSLDITRADVAFARELGIRMSVHVGIGSLGPDVQAVAQLARAGLLGRDFTFIHLSSTTDDELALIAAAGAGTCIGPATEMLMPGVGRPVTDRLLAHGLKPALSIDTETATSGSMFDQLRAVMSAAPEDGAARLSASDALELATSAGAAAVGMGGMIGRLTSGAAGDLILIDLTAVNLAPARDPLATIALAAHPGNVHTVIVDGVVLKRDGRLVGYDVAALTERARASVRTTLRNAP